MENSNRLDLRVTAPLSHIEFLAIDDARYGPLFEPDRNLLLSIVRYDASRPLPGLPGTLWETPKLGLDRASPPPSSLTFESASIEFGSGASDVFNSITAGRFHPSLPLSLSPPSLSTAFIPPQSLPPVFLPPPEHASLPPPPSAAPPQHIHINNFTANLNYHAGGTAAHISNGGSRPSSSNGIPPAVPSGKQPVPFVGAHFPPSYVAPFPASAASQPVFQHALPPPLPPAYHQMVMLPPGGPSLHFSMFPPGGAVPSYLSQPPPAAAGVSDGGGGLQDRRPRTEPSSSNITFGSHATALVSFKHLSSDEESADEGRSQGGKPTKHLQEEEEDEEQLQVKGDLLVAEELEQEPACPEATYAGGESDATLAAEVEPICEEVAAFSRQKQLQEAEDLARETSPQPHSQHPHQQELADNPPFVVGPRPTPPPFSILKTGPTSKVTSAPPHSTPSLHAEEPGKDKEEASGVPLPQQQAASGGKSWASLFSPPNPGVERIYSEKPTARIPPFSAVNEGLAQAATAAAAAAGSVEDRALGEFLSGYQLNHVAPAFLPRGLSNRSNWCFVNAILQALLACPPFYNLMKSLPATAVGLRSPSRHSSTPMMDAVVEFVNEFAPLESMNKSQKKDRGRKREDLPVGAPLEPGYVYNALLHLEEAFTLKVEEGRQEDAEEFLTCLLNMLSDEMLRLIKLTEGSAASPARIVEVGRFYNKFIFIAPR